jgi:hypothetical protein
MNPFKLPIRRAQFEEVVSLYKRRHKSIFAYDTSGALVVRDGIPERALNSWASAFWAGYDGLTKGVRVPTKDVVPYVWYRAGQAMRDLDPIIPSFSAA